MVSPVSGFIAEAVTQRLQHTTLPHIQPKLWIWYIDDTFVIIKCNKLGVTHHLINNVYTEIKVTIEEENNNQLQFLDVRVERMTNGEFQTSVYRKAAHTDQILNFHSNHPNADKQSCMRTLIKWATIHCNMPELRRREEERLYKVFTLIGYSLNFIY
eukprot:g46589.t1